MSVAASWGHRSLPTPHNLGVRSSEMSEFASERWFKDQGRRLRDRLARYARDLARGEQLSSGSLLKQARGVIARRLGLSDTRFKDILYGDARRIDAHEAVAIESAHRRMLILRAAMARSSASPVDLTAVRAELATLRSQMEALEKILRQAHGRDTSQSARADVDSGAGGVSRRLARRDTGDDGRGDTRRHAGRNPSSRQSGRPTTRLT